MCRRPAATCVASIPTPRAAARSAPRTRPRLPERMVGLFGGSFDPVHHGHLIVGQVAREALGLEALRFVPARQQPFRGGRHGAGAEHRAAMLVLALADAPGLAVELAELDRPGPSYTVDTL